MRRRETRRRKANKGAPKWMVTYSDMVTLILVFFILLFSMSQIDLVKFEAISDSFRNRMILDFYPSALEMENPTESTSHMKSGKQTNEFDIPALIDDLKGQGESVKGEEDSLSLLMNDVETYLDEHDLNNMISASRTERGVVLVLQEMILFNPGEAELISSGKPFLKKIGSLLSEIPNKVKVEGHTDSNPMSSYRYPSNWELSGARASSVIRYLIQENEFEESRFSLVGYGETRPIAPNDNVKNMMKNRRVEIVILDDNRDMDQEGDRK